MLAGRTYSAHRCRYMSEGELFGYSLSVGNCSRWCLIPVHLAIPALFSVELDRLFVTVPDLG